MTLLKTMMQRGSLTRLATATSATPATLSPKNPELVADVATVAVADSPKPQNHEAVNPADAGLPPAWAEFLTILCTMSPPQGLTSEKWHAFMGNFYERLLQHTKQQGETNYG